MSLRTLTRNKRTWLFGIPVLLIAVFVGGPYIYIHFIEGDPPAKLALAKVKTSESATTASTSLDGTWNATTGSAVQYRVGEVLFGQGTTAVGKTTAVTGNLSISGTTVPTATFTADLTKVTSDQANRDGQFQGRIMETATYPTATFELTSPIDLGSVPADGKQITVKAAGNLTLRGQTKAVSFDIIAQRAGPTISANGTIPIVFDDYQIPAPSFGPAQVEDHGELVFLINFKAA
ncbi:MAG: YceI family protein [Acidimicrobiia bacterium]